MNEIGNRPHNRQNENKPRRVPVSGMRDIMTVLNKEEGYEYRWVTDVDDGGSRIYKYKRGGWEMSPLQTTEGEIIVGEEAVFRTEAKEDVIRLHAGGGQFCYLMRIKKEWYDEDQKAKADAIDEMEASITQTGSSTGENFGQYGEVRIDNKKVSR